MLTSNELKKYIENEYNNCIEHANMSENSAISMMRNEIEQHFSSMPEYYIALVYLCEISCKGLITKTQFLLMEEIIKTYEQYKQVIKDPMVDIEALKEFQKTTRL